MLGKRYGLLAILAATVASVMAAVACASEPEVVTVVVERDREVPVIQTVLVERETITEVEVPTVRTVVVEREVEVAGETVVQTVVVERAVEREVPVIQTVVVEKEATREVQVQVQVTVLVEATEEPTFYGLPIPESNPTISEPPQPRTGSDTVVIRTGLEIRGSGIPGDPDRRHVHRIQRNREVLPDRRSWRRS